MIFQFCGSEVWPKNHWAEVEVLGGLCSFPQDSRRYCLLASSSVQRPLQSG